jgi:hypothetical protein
MKLKTAMFHTTLKIRGIPHSLTHKGNVYKEFDFETSWKTRDLQNIFSKSIASPEASRINKSLT